MTDPRASIVRLLERVVGRRRLIRTSRFVLNEARRDGRNRIADNGELLVQRTVLDAAGDEVVVFDVGANVGQWSAHLLDQRVARLELHVFEPASECVDRLRLILRPTESVNVTINHVAVSSSSGEATLFKPHPLAGSSSLHESSAGSPMLQEVVRTSTLDGYCRDHGIRHVDLLKIDAEGHDHHVMLGATGLLRARAIEIVQFEYNHRWMGPRHYLRDVFEHLSPFGYRVGKVTPDGIEWYPRWAPMLETLIEANFVATQPRLADRLPAIRWWAERDLVEAAER